MGTLVTLTRMCRNCGARIWRGHDLIWRHKKSGMARCPVPPGQPDRGTYADPQERRRQAA